MLQFLELCFAYINTETDLLISFWAAFLSFGPAVISEAISTVVLSLLAGAVVGFSLGLIGGGGSILAVPLLIYVVGVANTHVAIGTSALAVGVNALINMIHHRKGGHVRVKEGVVFAIPGAVGTIIGAQLGLLTSSGDLLILFAVFMTILSLFMLLKRRADPNNNNKKQEEKSLLSHHYHENSGHDKTNNDFEDRTEDDKNSNESHNSESGTSKHFLISILQNKKFYRLLIVGFIVGIGAGYFGIGGGFIIVPALMHTISGLTIIDAVGTSLISVSTFGFLTATRYSLNGEINWFIALLFIAGGVVGGFYGTRLSSKISRERLQKIFAIILLVVAVYMILMSITNA